MFDERVASSTSTHSTAFSRLISEDSLTHSVRKCVSEREREEKEKRGAFVDWLAHSLLIAACAECFIMALSRLDIIMILLFVFCKRKLQICYPYI